MNVTRLQQLEQLQTEGHFNVVILGGGINGACLYDTLCRQGYKVLLVDKGDFASGASQSSGMMIWGGLLYLRNFDLSSVFQLSFDRDRLIDQKARWMAPTMVRYLPTTGDRRTKWWVQSGLWFYWLMGMGRRRAPRSEVLFTEAELIRPGLVKSALCYEEAFLDQSDARFVFRWIGSPQTPCQIALNYCDVQGSYAPKDKRWHLELTDTMSAKRYEIQSSMIVNCTGVWTDQVNANFGIDSPFRHALSKGVYLGIPRDERHQSSLFFELGKHNDVITHVPWGPNSLWGPTETAVKTIAEGLSASREDIDFLLEQYALRYRKPISRSDIVSVRCGIRPLVVDKHYKSDCYPLDLSRRQEVVQDEDKPWISCYGGKLTGCSRMSAKVLKLIKKSVVPTGEMRIDNHNLEAHAQQMPFPGLTQPIMSAAWCAKHELCCTLEDYLRRRTNIAQWTPRGGLGKNNTHAPILKDISLLIANGDAILAAQLFESYRSKIENTLDPLLA